MPIIHREQQIRLWMILINGEVWRTPVITRIYSFNRIAIVPPFSGLWQFPEGRGFKQWTGDDSKALMKVSHQDLVLPHMLLNISSLGLSTCNTRSRTARDYTHSPCIPGILLHNTSRCLD